MTPSLIQSSRSLVPDRRGVDGEMTERRDLPIDFPLLFLLSLSLSLSLLSSSSSSHAREPSSSVDEEPTPPMTFGGTLPSTEPERGEQNPTVLSICEFTGIYVQTPGRTPSYGVPLSVSSSVHCLGPVDPFARGSLCDRPAGTTSNTFYG